MTHVPIRTCLGCGQKKDRGALIRLVVGADGQLMVDPAGTQAGRGAWLCGPGCLPAAVKRKAFGRAFRGRAGRVDVERLAVALAGAGLQGGEIGLDAATRRNEDAAPEG